MNVYGIDLQDEERVLPVEIRCHVCGATAVFGGNGDSAALDDLTDWSDTHECPRNQTVN